MIKKGKHFLFGCALVFTLGATANVAGVETIRTEATTVNQAPTVSVNSTPTNVPIDSGSVPNAIFIFGTNQGTTEDINGVTGTSPVADPTKATQKVAEMTDADGTIASIGYNDSKTSGRFDLASATDPDANNPNDALRVNTDGYLTGNLIYGPGAKSTRRLEVTDNGGAMTTSDSFMVLGYTDKVSDTTAVGLEYGVRPTLTDITAKMAIDVNSSYPNAVPSTLVIPETQYTRGVVGYRMVGSTDVTAVTSADQLPATGDYEVKVKTKNIYGQEIFNWVSVDHADNTPPTVTINSTPTNVPIDSGSVPNAIFIFGTNQGTTEDINGATGTSPVADPTKATQKVAEMTDADGTIASIGYNDSKTSGRFDLASATDPNVNNPNDALLVNTDGYLTGHLIYGPGAKSTRRLEVTDNGGAMTTSDTFMVLGYTDKVNDTTAVAKELGVRPTADDIYSKLAIDVNSSYPNAVPSTLVIPEDQYSREIIGYRIVGSTDVTAATSADQLPDTGNYEVRVKTTNIYGQEIYNWVSVTHPENIAPTVSQTIVWKGTSLSPAIDVDVNDVNSTATRDDIKEVYFSSVESTNNLGNPGAVSIIKDENGNYLMSGTPEGEAGYTWNRRITAVDKQNATGQSNAFNINILDSNVISEITKPENSSVTAEEVLEQVEVLSRTVAPTKTHDITSQLVADGGVTKQILTDLSTLPKTGRQIVQVQLTSPSGHTKIEEVIINFTPIDSTAPEAPSVVANADGTVTVKPSQTDGDDTKTVDITYTDENGTEQTVTVTKADDGTWSVPADSGVTVDATTGAVTIPADKVKDSSPVTAVSKDEVGNTSTTSAATTPATTDNVTPVAPAVTEVTDPTNLTDAEKAKVKEEVENSNPALPIGTTVEVGNDGTVTITYPDGSVDTIPATDTVVSTTPTPQTDAEKNDLTNPTKTPVSDTNNLTDEEKAKVKEEVENSNPALPTGTTVEVGNDGTVTITYPDGSVDTIPAADTVVSTTPTPQTDAEKNDLTNPTKTPVSDTNNLTDEEKAKVKEEVENSNPALPTGTEVTVGNDGTVTITYPDGSVDTIPATDTVVSTTPTPQTDAEKNDLTNPTKTPVSDTNNLTEDEKAKVKEEVEKSNPNLPTGTTVEVGNDGTVTITYPDGSVDTISGTDTVVSTTPTPQTDAEKNDLTNPTKTQVGDTNNLTDEEKAKVKEEVENSNPDLPTGITITVGNDGTATITYPDGSVDTIPGNETVATEPPFEPTPQTDAEKNGITTPTKTPVADTNNLTEDEKAKVKEEVEKSTPGLPTGTTITVGNDGTVTVTYPDGSVDTIPGADTVVSTTPTPQTDAEKNGITTPTKTPVADTNNLTEDEKAKVKEEVEKSNPGLPTGTTIEVGNDGTVTITYPDGSVDTVSSTDTVVSTTPTPQTDAEKNDLTNPTKTPVSDTNNLTEDERAKVKEEVEKSNPGLPTGTTIGVSNGGSVTITYPDGSIDIIPGADAVVPTTPTPQTDAEKNGITTPTKTPVSDTNNLTEDEKAKVKEEVEKSNPGLPTGTTIEIGNDGTVTITYPDGSVDTIPGTDTVVSTTPTPQTDAEKNDLTTPTKTSVSDTNNLTDEEKAKVQEEVKKSNPNLPTGTEVKVGNDGTVTVTYPDGSVDTIPGADTVAPNADTSAPVAPSVNVPNAGDKTVTGSAKPGSTVTVTFPDGSTVTTIADENGNFTVDVPAGVELKAGDKVTASAIDKAGNVSASTVVTVISTGTVNEGAEEGITEQNSEDNKQAVLPNTGEESGMMSLMGLAGLAALGLLGFKRRRKEEE
ncbi:GA module-containing protein [Streptococcus suis]|nr:GA module-containing protein [Streptococcus suis]